MRHRPLTTEQVTALLDVLERAAEHVTSLPNASMVTLTIAPADIAPADRQQWTDLDVRVQGVPVLADEWRFALPCDETVIGRSPGSYWIALGSVVADVVTPWLRDHGIGSTFTRPDQTSYRAEFVRARWP